MCNDWKNLPVIPSDSKNKKTTTCYQATQAFSLTEFYKKTHDVHSLMGTRTKINNGKTLDHQDFLSAPQMVSPLKDYVFCYLLLYELYGQLTSFMTLENLDQVLSVCSSSNLAPNIFPYTQDLYIPISELLATKSAAQGNHKNSIHPPITNYKKEDIASYAQMLNPTRKPTAEYIKNKLSSYSNSSIQQQGFLDFFKNLGDDIVHAGESAWSDIKQGAESAWHCVKHLGEAAGLGIAGFALEIGGKGAEGANLINESQEDLATSITDLKSTVDDFVGALKDGVVAPVAELTGDLVGFLLDDQKVGEDFETIIDNSASVIVKIVGDATESIAVGVVYFKNLSRILQFDTLQLVVAAVYAASGHTDEASDICHSVLRSLVTIYLMSAKVIKDDFADIMQALSVATNAITTLFNDLIVEVAAIIVTGGWAEVFNIVMAASGQDQYNYLTKANNLVRNTLNQHREVENQVLGLAVTIGATVATGGGAAAIFALTTATVSAATGIAASTVHNSKAQEALMGVSIGSGLLGLAGGFIGGEGAATEALDVNTAEKLNTTISDAEKDLNNAQDAFNKAKDSAQQAENQAQAAQKAAEENPDDPEAQSKAEEAKAKDQTAKKNVREQEDAIRQAKQRLANAQNLKKIATQEAADLKYGKTIIEKMKISASKFFERTKKFIIFATEKGSNLVSSTKNIFSDLTESLAGKISSTTISNAKKGVTELETTINTVENLSKEGAELSADANTMVSPELSEKLSSNMTEFSNKTDNLSNARSELQKALDDWLSAQKDDAKIADAQKAFLNASKKVQQSLAETEKTVLKLQSNLQSLANQQKNFEANPLLYVSKNIDESAAQAEKDLQTAEEKLAIEEAQGNENSINEAQTAVNQAKQKLNTIKNLQNVVTQESEKAANLISKEDVSLSEKFSGKVKDAQNYIKNQKQSFIDLFTKNNQEAEEAALKVKNEKEVTLKSAQKQLEEDKKAFDTAKAAAKEKPDDPDTQADFDRAQRKLENTQKEVRAAQKDYDNADEYYKERQTITKESKWGKFKRYLGKIGDAISPIGMVMNVVFNITPIISSYNQDQKNILQQKQQAEQMEELWKANTETKISTVYSSLEYLEEFYEKQKNSIGNQVIGLSLLQNYNYESISQFEKSILQSLAMIYTLQLYPNPKTNLVTGNTGTLWGIISPYLNLYPSQGFYTTTIGRSEFPFAQEIAQAPELLTATSKVKVKEWFNQRCTAIDKKNENQSLKNPMDPLNVSISFKFLYTLESEFYVGICMGKNYYDYFNTSYISSLLGTTINDLTNSYSTFIQNPVAYPFKLNFIDLTESYMAKMIVLYRKTSTDSLKLGVYEHNLTKQQWLFTQELPANSQLSVDHVYNLEATLNNDTLQISLIVDQQTQSKISQTVKVTPLDNQRQYGIISSSAAIEWNQLSPKVTINKASAIRKPNKNLTPEIERGKANKLAIKDAVSQTFGGKELKLISQHNALIFGQYIYASVQTDISKITPKNPADLLIFATNTNGKITNLGKMPNSFVDSKTNVLVSLITGHVFDTKWNCIQTIPQPWNIYSAPAANYGPFNPSINKIITDQQQALSKKLSKIKFGSFNLDIANNALMVNGQYVYTCTQTLQDSSGKPFTDYLVFAEKIDPNPTKITLGLPPTSANSDCIISLISGNIYTKATIIPSTGVPVSSQPAVSIYNIDIINYIEQLNTTITYNGSPTSFTQIIQNQKLHLL